jgi:hypothetical protein
MLAACNMSGAVAAYTYARLRPGPQIVRCTKACCWHSCSKCVLGRLAPQLHGLYCTLLRLHGLHCKGAHLQRSGGN